LADRNEWMHGRTVDQLTAEARSERMARVRSKDTEPELRFRKAIWRAGYRFRTCDARLPGKPDLTFARHRLAVFIDGDFWHGHQWRTRRLLQLDDQFTAAANGDYWRQKIRRNVERDFRHTAALVADGWSVLRFWESDIRRDLQRCVNMTLAALKKPKHERDATLLAGRTVAEFFAGVGLVRLALENRGWQVVYANDFDEQKAALYRSNFAGDHLSTADVHAVSAD